MSYQTCSTDIFVDLPNHLAAIWRENFLPNSLWRSGIGLFASLCMGSYWLHFDTYDQSISYRFFARLPDPATMTNNALEATASSFLFWETNHLKCMAIFYITCQSITTRSSLLNKRHNKTFNAITRTISITRRQPFFWFWFYFTVQGDHNQFSE